MYASVLFCYENKKMMPNFNKGQMTYFLLFLGPDMQTLYTYAHPRRISLMKNENYSKYAHRLPIFMCISDYAYCLLYNCANVVA